MRQFIAPAFTGPRQTNYAMNRPERDPNILHSAVSKEQAISLLFPAASAIHTMRPPSHATRAPAMPYVLLTQGQTAFAIAKKFSTPKRSLLGLGTSSGADQSPCERRI